MLSLQSMYVVCSQQSGEIPGRREDINILGRYRVLLEKQDSCHGKCINLMPTRPLFDCERETDRVENDAHIHVRIPSF
jgi:hypothetical protein